MTRSILRGEKLSVLVARSKSSSVDRMGNGARYGTRKTKPGLISLLTKHSMTARDCIILAHVVISLNVYVSGGIVS
jgi:hypothetical protein